MKIHTLIIALFLTALNSHGQDTINAINNTLKTSKLIESKNTYLVYTENSLHEKTSSGDIWEREITFDKIQNKDIIRFTWKWYKNDSLLSLTSNICDKQTLKPLYHKLTYKDTLVVAYDFKDGFLVPTDSIDNNYVKNYPKRALTIPVINWEQDLETLPLLPIKNIGQKFCISFFDVNEKEPAYHTYEVTGEDTLKFTKDISANCWLLKINYSDVNYSLFWLSKQSLEVLKMEEYFNGNYRYKVKLY